MYLHIFMCIEKVMQKKKIETTRQSNIQVERSEDDGIRCSSASSVICDTIYCFLEKILIRPCLVSKNFQDFPSHRMFGHIHGTLNVDEKKTNYTVW
jgi:hypothetical protein